MTRSGHWRFSDVRRHRGRLFVSSNEEFDAELDQKRQEARQKIARSKRLAKSFVAVIFLVVAVGSVLFLRQYSQLFTGKTAITIMSIVAIFVGFEILAIKINTRNSKPLSEVAISSVLLLSLFAALAFVL